MSDLDLNVHADRALKLLRKLRAFYQEFQSETYMLRETLQQIDQGARTDVGFCMREIEQAADELRKDAKRWKEIAAKLIGFTMAAESLNSSDEDEDDDDDAEDTVERLARKIGNDHVSAAGQLASAYPRMTVMPRMPAVGSDEYRALMRWAGVSEEHVEKGTLRFSFKEMQAMLEEALQKGGENPPGILETFEEWTCTFRVKTRKRS